MGSLRNSALLLLAAALASFATGCYGPKHRDCMVECGPEGACPPGMTCRGGACSAGPQCGTDAGPDTGDDGATTDRTDAATSSDGDDARDDAPDVMADRSPDLDGDDGDVDGPTPNGILDGRDGPDGSDDADADMPVDVDAEGPMDADGAVPTDTDAMDGRDAPEVNDAMDTPEVSQPDVDVRVDQAPDRTEALTPWTPGVIPQLVLWLEADNGIGVAPDARVQVWLDRSGFNNNAVQPQLTFAPKFVPNAFNGAPGVQFGGNTWMAILDAASLRWGFDPFLLVVLYRATGRCEGSCVLQELYRKQEVDFPWRGPGLGLKPEGRIEVHLWHDGLDQWFTSGQVGYDSGRTHLAGIERRASGQVIMRIDGAELWGFPPTAVVRMDAPAQNVYIGAHGVKHTPPDDFPFNGYMGAIIAVKGPISPTDLTALESYLMGKYGAVSGGPP